MKKLAVAVTLALVTVVISSNAGPFAQKPHDYSQDPNFRRQLDDDGIRMFLAQDGGDPQFFQAWFEIGVIEANRGPFDTALSSANKAIAILLKELRNPANNSAGLVVVHRSLADSYRLQGSGLSVQFFCSKHGYG